MVVTIQRTLRPHGLRLVVAWCANLTVRALCVLWYRNSDCLNQDDQKWHCFNDSRVSQTSSSRLSGSAAYMLFYQRRGYSMSNKGSGSHL